MYWIGILSLPERVLLGGMGCLCVQAEAGGVVRGDDIYVSGYKCV